jgi:hypothetical protein
MRKTAVYSWRLAPGTKSALEHEARRAGKSLGALLDEIAAEWLRARRDSEGDDAEAQDRLQAAVARTIGCIAGRDPGRSEHVRTRVRERLNRRRAS